MADLEMKQGREHQAAMLYHQLAAETTGDARPVLALAMLRGEQGRIHEMQVNCMKRGVKGGLKGWETH